MFVAAPRTAPRRAMAARRPPSIFTSEKSASERQLIMRDGRVPRSLQMEAVSGHRHVSGPDVGKAVHAYLAAVYPAAHRWLSRLGLRQLMDCFDTLDYLYSCSDASLAMVHPHLTLQHSYAIPALPYIPRGAFYRATGSAPLDVGRFNAILWSAFDRHLLPVQVLPAELPSHRASSFHSSFGARLGPQPSWTSPFAIVRYVHYPNGLEAAIWPQANGSVRKATIGGPLAHPFDVAYSSRVTRWSWLRDGDAIEVEQWGGFLSADECPPICGLWANVWRGTGVMLRVRTPFVSLNKATAIVEMFAALALRNASALEALSFRLGAASDIDILRERHPGTSVADCLSTQLITDVPRAGGHSGPQFARLKREWEAFVSRSSPRDAVEAFLSLGDTSLGSNSTRGPLLSTASGRFALHWTFGINGKGKNSPFWRRSPVGPDGLLSTLACMLGHHTVILVASSNDNGLLHQELVDFELPEPLGWPVTRGQSTNDASWCMQQPFAFVQDDARRGPSAQAVRRRQMLDFWRSTGKFRLPTDPGGAPDQPTLPCSLAFGGGIAEGHLSDCRGPKTRVPTPTAAKTCYAWCNGTLSALALSQASLGHARFDVLGD